MGNNCIQQDCSLECCTIDGYCPTESIDCYYDYSSTAGTIAAIVIGSVLLVVCIVIGVYLFLRRRIREEVDPEEVARRQRAIRIEREKMRAEMEVGPLSQLEHQMQRRSQLIKKNGYENKGNEQTIERRNLYSERRLTTSLQIRNPFEQLDRVGDENRANRTYL